MNRIIRKETGIVFVLIVLAVLMRLIPHAPNLTPIGAIALFSGAHLRGVQKAIIPLAALLISDLFLGFHSTMPYVYGSFVLIAIVGSKIKSDAGLIRIGTGALISSFLFFFITNFGVWAAGSLYRPSIFGLIDAYVMGIPFLRNTLVGDLFYTTLLFYLYRFSLHVTTARLLHGAIRR